MKSWLLFTLLFSSTFALAKVQVRSFYIQTLPCPIDHPLAPCSGNAVIFTKTGTIVLPIYLRDVWSLPFSKNTQVFSIHLKSVEGKPFSALLGTYLGVATPRYLPIVGPSTYTLMNKYGIALQFSDQSSLNPLIEPFKLKITAGNPKDPRWQEVFALISR